MANYVTITSNKKKKTAFWMCVFGGIFGLHYFYVGSQCFRTVVNGLSHAVPDWVSIPLLAYTFMTPLNEMLRHKGKEPCHIRNLLELKFEMKSNFGDYGYSAM